MGADAESCCPIRRTPRRRLPEPNSTSTRGKHMSPALLRPIRTRGSLTITGNLPKNLAINTFHFCSFHSKHVDRNSLGLKRKVDAISEIRSRVGVIMRIPATRFSSNGMGEVSGSEEIFPDLFFGFSDEIEGAPGNFSTSDDDEGNEEENMFHSDAKKAFWQTQEELLLGTLRRTSSVESNIRRSTKELLKELNSESLRCGCRRSLPVGSCRNCLKREICNRLQDSGYNCVICKSKWKSSSDIPSGEHTYLEVVDNSKEKKGEVRVVIEINFRAEFQMARASDEYNLLISRLPEVFIGKWERLKALIKILCSAAKNCMKEKKMHLGPWRKDKYMEAKWLGTFDRTALPSPLPVAFSGRPQKAKASMLTFDLGEKLAKFHCTGVEVV